MKKNMQKTLIYDVFPACFITDSLITVLCRVPQPQRQSQGWRKSRGNRAVKRTGRCAVVIHTLRTVCVTRTLMLFWKHNIAIIRRVTQTLLQAFLRELQSCSPTPKVALCVVWMLYHLYVHKFTYGSLSNQNAVLTGWQGNYSQNTFFSPQ